MFDSNLKGSCMKNIIAADSGSNVCEFFEISFQFATDNVQGLKCHSILPTLVLFISVGV